MPPSPSPNDTPAPRLLPGEVLDELERVRAPAFVFVPGGRIVAVNRAAAGLSPFPFVGMTVGELLARFGAHRADGRRLTGGDMPHVRALRGEVVVCGERIDITLPDGSIFRAHVTSRPVVADGEVVASLSILHDFDEYLHELASAGEAPVAEGRQGDHGRSKTGGEWMPPSGQSGRFPSQAL